ncbi:MAG: DUF5615 family PIN-like protein [Candidatus Accumulibacter sp.]|jgi:predicted nuclease of predicted toxin-antitoxin system|nr:DUF5615 family PIN-like protein [Accumulibacter sp.]
MKLLVDEDSQSRRQMEALRAAGHDAVSVAGLDRNGAPDSEVFALAQTLGRTLLTHNVGDFLELARKAGHHAGVLAVFRDGNPRHTMSHGEIVQAIAALEAAGIPVQNQFHVLNHWR